MKPFQSMIYMQDMNYEIRGKKEIGILTVCRSKICYLHPQRLWWWAGQKAPWKQSTWKLEAKLGGFLSNMVSKFHPHTKLLAYLSGFLCYRALISGNLQISIPKPMPESLILRPIWNKSRPSSSTNNLRLLYLRSWLATKYFLVILLKNSSCYFQILWWNTQYDLG